MANPTNTDIMRALGQFDAKLDRLRIDLDTTNEHSELISSRIQDKLDTQAVHMSELGFKIETAANLAAQARDESRTVKDETNSRLDKLDATIAKEIKPTIDDFRTMRRIGLGIVGIIAMGGLSAGALLVWAGDTAINIVRHFLRIDV